MWKLYNNGGLMLQSDMIELLKVAASLNDVVEVYIINKTKEIHVIASKEEFDRKTAQKIALRKTYKEKAERHSGYIDEPGYRFCWSCKISKPETEFGYRKYRDDGLSTQCKTCVNKKAKRRRRRNKNG